VGSIVIFDVRRSRDGRTVGRAKGSRPPHPGTKLILPRYTGMSDHHTSPKKRMAGFIIAIAVIAGAAALFFAVHTHPGDPKPSSTQSSTSP
jgi:hypothetical protein